jgi:hypothetical protein
MAKNNSLIDMGERIKKFKILSILKLDNDL